EAKRIVVQDEGTWEPIDWSPNDKQLLVNHAISANESYLWVVDLESGKRTPVANQGKVDGEPIAYFGGVFDPSGSGLFFTSDESAEFQRLRWTKVGSTTSEFVGSEMPWDVGILARSEDRSRIALA